MPDLLILYAMSEGVPLGGMGYLKESGAVAALIPLLWCSDSWTQEHAVTALLNLSLLEENKALITNAGAVKSLIYVLKRGTETSKQNAVLVSC